MARFSLGILIPITGYTLAEIEKKKFIDKYQISRFIELIVFIND